MDPTRDRSITVRSGLPTWLTVPASIMKGRMVLMSRVIPLLRPRRTLQAQPERQDRLHDPRPPGPIHRTGSAVQDETERRPGKFPDTYSQKIGGFIVDPSGISVT
jgi:hypothetical protein